MANTYAVRLIGETPLLMHWDNLLWAARMERWQKDPANKSKSVAGDDRTPAWRWLGNLYVDCGRVCIPADNLQTALREGGAKVGAGRKGQTYKRHTQSGMVVNESSWPLVVGGKTLNGKELFERFIGIEDFAEHERMAAELGVCLFSKRARIGTSKHVRVRPRFDAWECSGTITVFDDQVIPGDALRMILESAGSMCGLCDWRPSSPKSPGPFGRFRIEMKKDGK
jgi:hypothetical protein